MHGLRPHCIRKAFCVWSHTKGMRCLKAEYTFIPQRCKGAIRRKVVVPVPTRYERLIMAGGREGLPQPLELRNMPPGHSSHLKYGDNATAPTDNTAQIDNMK